MQFQKLSKKRSRQKTSQNATRKKIASDERVCVALRQLQWQNKTSDRQLEAVLDLVKELADLLQNGAKLPDKISSKDREMRKKVINALTRVQQLFRQTQSSPDCNALFFRLVFALFDMMDAFTVINMYGIKKTRAIRVQYVKAQRDTTRRY